LLTFTKNSSIRRVIMDKILASPAIPSACNTLAMESATPLAAASDAAKTLAPPSLAAIVYDEYSVLLFGGLQEAAGAEKVTLQIAQSDSENGVTVEHLRAACADKFPQLARWMPYIAVAVNCEYSQAQTRVFPGDEIAFLPPVAGGSGSAAESHAECARAAITDSVLDENAVRDTLERQAAGSAGAVITFVGVVRDNARDNEGQVRQVEALEYSAYHPMAVRALEKIVDEVQIRYGAACVIQHRVGRLEIGEASVVIGVACAHRETAFDACRYALETLKREVPIWKKEFARDGSYWVAGPSREYSQTFSETEAVTT
jgi:molybdopterin synthase catalytic subunit/molybdopterin converting factor small subunit